MKPTILFARRDSIYKSMGLDVWDIDRDARGYMGSAPVIAHPPCRAWGRLAHMAKPRYDEKELAIFAVNQVRRVGGILEHPEFSGLWAKATWLYMVGIEVNYIPYELGKPAGRIEMMSKKQREETPEKLAAWMVDLAERCKV